MLSVNLNTKNVCFGKAKFLLCTMTKTNKPLNLLVPGNWFAHPWEHKWSLISGFLKSFYDGYHVWESVFSLSVDLLSIISELLWFSRDMLPCKRAVIFLAFVFRSEKQCTCTVGGEWNLSCSYDQRNNRWRKTSTTSGSEGYCRHQQWFPNIYNFGCGWPIYLQPYQYWKPAHNCGLHQSRFIWFLNVSIQEDKFLL